jgi:hypothetical protein
MVLASISAVIVMFLLKKAQWNKMIKIIIRVPKKLEKEELKIRVQPAKKYTKKIKLEIIR